MGLILGSCGFSNESCKLHKGLKMAWLADWLLVYQDILCFTKLPSYHKLVQFKLGFQYVAPTSWCIFNAFQTPAWTLENVAERKICWEWNVCNVMVMPLTWIVFLSSVEVGNNKTNVSDVLIIRIEEGYSHNIIEIICKMWAYWPVLKPLLYEFTLISLWRISIFFFFEAYNTVSSCNCLVSFCICLISLVVYFYFVLHCV